MQLHDATADASSAAGRFSNDNIPFKLRALYFTCAQPNQRISYTATVKCKGKVVFVL
jgi:hypothetical protein